jgi:tRNA G26 N,N-dimethylase Trm1
MEEATVRPLTPLASEGRTHLTANGAVTLCGRAITNKWSRTRRPGDRACRDCDQQATAIGPVSVAPRYEVEEGAAVKAGSP